MLKPLFYTRDLQSSGGAWDRLNHFQASWLGVESARWAMVGGPDVARLKGTFLTGCYAIGGILDRLDLARALGLLRCGVELVDESGTAAWWGYVSGVELSIGALGVVADLEKMNNRVKVSYTSLNINTPAGGGIVNYTDWGDEPASEGIYGVKEKIINLRAVSDRLALLKRGLEIGENGFPQAIPMVKTAGNYIKNDIVLTLRGWWHTAGWRYYNRSDGIIEDLEETAQQGVGNSTEDVHLYQSFTIDTDDWRVECAWLKAANTGENGDSLQVDICEDSGGSPGASLASASLVGTEITKSFAWKCFVFSSPPTLAAGLYWLKVARTGPTHAGWAYSVKVDENQSYEGGEMWVNDGPRSPAADMVFQVVGGSETTEQIMVMAGAGAGGQFLNGVRVEVDSGIYTSQYRAGGSTALQEMSSLLGAGDMNGNRLLAEVTQDRILRVYAAPGAGTAGLYVNQAGKLVDRSGLPVPVWTPAAGRWVVVAGAWGEVGSQYQQVKDRVLLEAVEYDPVSGGLRPG